MKNIFMNDHYVILQIRQCATVWSILNHFEPKYVHFNTVNHFLKLQFQPKLHRYNMPSQTKIKTKTSECCTICNILMETTHLFLHKWSFEEQLPCTCWQYFNVWYISAKPCRTSCKPYELFWFANIKQNSYIYWEEIPYPTAMAVLSLDCSFSELVRF